MTSPLDITKPVQTRDDGLEAAICGRCPDPSFPLIGWHRDTRGNILTGRWTEDGGYFRSNSPHRFDLINVPEKHTVWAVIASEADRPCDSCANVPRIGYAYLFDEKPSDLRHVGGIGSTVSACIQIEYQDGEGL
jgi:hypothetical protein